MRRSGQPSTVAASGPMRSTKEAPRGVGEGSSAGQMGALGLGAVFKRAQQSNTISAILFRTLGLAKAQF